MNSDRFDAGRSSAHPCRRGTLPLTFWAMLALGAQVACSSPAPPPSDSAQTRTEAASGEAAPVAARSAVPQEESGQALSDVAAADLNAAASAPPDRFQGHEVGTLRSVPGRVMPGQVGWAGFNQKDLPGNFDLKVLANGSGSISLRSLVGPESSSSLDGVVVAFAAQWCGRCKASYPTLKELQAQHGGKLKILLLTADKSPEDKQKMVSILKAMDITLPLLDADDGLQELWLGQQQNIPRFYLLDYEGRVRVKDTGFGDKMKRLLPEHVAWLLARRAQEQATSAPL